MIIQFNKFQGAGNDYIIIDNREGIFISDNYSGTGVAASVIASVLSGHFDTTTVSIGTIESIKTI
jgi:diaminopimelate epimerase